MLTLLSSNYARLSGLDSLFFFFFGRGEKKNDGLLLLKVSIHVARPNRVLLRASSYEMNLKTFSRCEEEKGRSKMAKLQLDDLYFEWVSR